MNVRFSSQRFPVNLEVKEGSGSIFGCVIQPFKNNFRHQENSKNIGRCKKCFAYINNFVKFERGGWICNICESLNKINYTGYNNIDDSSGDNDDDDNDDDDDDDDNENNSRQQHQISRYARPNRELLPELSNSSIELLVDQDQFNGNGEIGNGQESLPDSIPYSMIPLMINPIYIAIVDYSGNQEQHDAITQGLEALIHALPNNALFGLITYSTRIGLYNLNTSTPLIKFVENITDFNFSDILSIEKFLVNKGKNESNIIKAIQSIPLINETISKKLKSYALDDTLKLLMDYLAIDLFKLNVKIGLFISESPVENNFSSLEELSNNYGKQDFFKPTTNIYRKLAERSIEVGAHFDIFAVGDNHFGFDSIKFLSTLTGGQIYRYNKLLPTCTLPQDIYKLISYGWGFHGLLRIRTSKQFSIDCSYGPAIASKQYDNLYHIESSNPFTSVAFEFKFNNSSGFQDKDLSPNIQIAFSYSYLPPTTANDQQQPLNSSIQNILRYSGSNGINNNSAGDRFIEKRLHIFNLRVPVADTPADVFNSIDLETTISLLTNKIIRETLEKGISEARISLVDWLKNIITKYNENVVILSSVTSSIDVNFSQVSHLRPLPRYVFALLKSPILRELTTDIEASTIKKKSDDWVYHQCLYSNLEPRLLHRSIYPVLYSYGAPNNLASKYLPLSQNTILTSTSHIYLIDSFDQLVVFYNLQEVSNQHQFPPPPESLIRQTISNSKQDRLIVPEIQYIKGKLIENPIEFTKFLIDEENNSGPSFYNFLRDISSNVKGRF
ncbi:hypothetical protein RB653_006690 [Dictyostelium firmibasis]|uniref:Protein transport protein SEC24 n=1 Tax=Dictyostelium firmibasis TaxID=79012 RepID=A0AAN7YTZ0_9MYCE